MKISRTDVLKKHPDNHVFYKNDRILVVNRDTGGYMVMNKRFYKILDELKTPKPFENLSAHNEDIPKNTMYRFISGCEKNNIISKNFISKKPSYKRTYNPEFIIYLTEDCNFNCRYCCNDFKKRKKISKEIIDNIMEKIALSYKDHEINISFHGGEPLLEKESLIYGIEKAIKTFERFEKKANLNFLTNGYLLDKKTSEELLKKGIKKVCISLDGNKNIHEKFRTGKITKDIHERILINTRIARNNGLNIIIYSTVLPKDIRESYYFLKSEGFKQLAYQLLRNEGMAKKSGIISKSPYYEYVPEIISLYEEITACNEKLKLKDRIYERNLSRIFRKIVQREIEDPCLDSPCGIIKKTLSFSPEGDIYPCNLFYGKKDFKLSNIKEIKDLKELNGSKEIIEKAKTRAEKTNRCSGCVFLKICSGHCMAVSYKQSGKFNSVTDQCVFYFNLIKEIMFQTGKKEFCF